MSIRLPSLSLKIKNELPTSSSVIIEVTISTFLTFCKNIVELTTLDTNIYQLASSSGKTFYQYILSDQLIDCQVFIGEKNNDGRPSLGWVSPRYNQLEPAPVLKCQQSSAGYFVINIFSEQKFETLPTFQRLNNIISIRIIIYISNSKRLCAS